MTLTRPRFDMFIWQALPWPVLLDDVRYVEKLPVGTAWIADHYASPHNPASPLLEAWTALAALAAGTSRIRLGTSISNVSTRHPAFLAKQAATVDVISGGRVDLGLGPGYYEREHAWLGIPFLSPGGRVDRLGEAVAVIDGLLRSPPLSYHAELYHLDEAPLVPRPVQQPRPPLFIAANGRRALRIAAQHGDGWLSLGPDDGTEAEAIAQLRQRNEQLAEQCAAIGRDPATVERAYFTGWAKEFPFVSRDGFYDFVGRYQEAGIDRFIFLYASAGQSRQGVAAGTWAGRETLEAFAADAMAELQGARPAKP